jgi:exodeoxyribonuclease (lambda-induced)
MPQSAKQRTKEWFGERLGFVTASKFAVILSGPSTKGWQDYRTQIALERLLLEREETFSSFAMKEGVKGEPLAIKAYEAETGFITKEAPFVKHPFLLAGASPDRFVQDTDGNNGLAEVKCPQPPAHRDTLRKNKMPTQYKAQTQGQMWITELEWNDYISYNPNFNVNARLFIERQYRDEPYISKLESLTIQFLEEVEQEYNFLKEYKLQWQPQLTT